MTTLYFIRHGESVANTGGVTMEHAVIPLSPLGHTQARALAEQLTVEPSRILVSSYARALATAAPFCAKTGRQAEVHSLLHEFSALDPAMLQGMDGAQRRPIADAYWEAADPAVRMGPAAETFLEFDARVASFIDELPQLLDRTVLFGHGIWFKLMCWRLSGHTPVDSAGMRAFRRFQSSVQTPNGAVFTIQRQTDPAQTGPGAPIWEVRTLPLADLPIAPLAPF